jgi:cold shock CspA family protein/ribosome-associated translation inhibitor RaiA
MEIHWKNLDGVRLDVRQRIEQRLQALAGSHGDLIDVRIAAKTTGHHVHGGQEVRIAAQARGKEQIVAARTRPDVGQALDEVVDAFEREVRRMREKRRDSRNGRAAEPPELGVVDRVFAGQGYGFILTDGGERVYFHRNAVREGLRFHELEEGQRVGLNFEAGEKGLQATAVMAPPPDAPVP